MKLENIDNPKRGLNGFYSHPQLPVWDESTTQEQMNLWLKSHSVKLSVVMLENDADEEVCKKYFDIGIGGCSDWNPTVPHGDAILLSIHDTDDGPMAAYAVPENQELEQNKGDFFVMLTTQNGSYTPLELCTSIELENESELIEELQTLLVNKFGNEVPTNNEEKQ